MRLALVFVTIIHGLIHLLGWVKAFNITPVLQLTQPISKASGMLWLLAMILLLMAAYGLLMRRDWWWMVAMVAVLLSQALIIMQWQDARYGTVLNVVIGIAVLAGWAGWSFYKTFTTDAIAITHVKGSEINQIIAAKDLAHLPEPVRKYLAYTGVINTPRLHHVRILFDGEMRGMGQDWFPFESEQYNSFDIPNRLFFMKALMKGMTVPGYHTFRDGDAQMTIRLFSMYPIVHHEGREMDIAETVTVLNDMCILAPASLVYAPILWETIDSQTVRATFTHKDVTISASLLFGPDGQLINFISDDRYDLSGKQPMRYRWSTPMSHYKTFHGIRVPAYGEAIWHYPDGEFAYGKFYLRDIRYNGVIGEG